MGLLKYLHTRDHLLNWFIHWW